MGRIYSSHGMIFLSHETNIFVLWDGSASDRKPYPLPAYIEQNKVTKNGTLKSTTNPWNMETTTNCCPAVRVIIGSVVSIVVAPPAEMGAKLPNQRTSNGAANKVSISRLILASSAMVPSSAPLYSVMKMLESE